MVFGNNFTDKQQNIMSKTVRRAQNTLANLAAKVRFACNQWTSL